VFPVTQNFLEALRLMRLYTLGTELFASALWIALPMLALLLFTNLALGIISRVAPQMNVFAIGFPVTLAVGLVGLTATLPMLDQPFQSLLERSIEIFMGR
jgi:flagellar biosynthetic protein FliR